MHLLSTAHKTKSFCSHLAVPLRCSATWGTSTSISQLLGKKQNIFSITEQIFITQFCFYKTAMPLLLPLFPSKLSFISPLLRMSFPFPPSLYHLNPPWLPQPPFPSSLAGSGCGGRSHYCKLLKLENFARVNHFALLLLQLGASQNLPFTR